VKRNVIYEYDDAFLELRLGKVRLRCFTETGSDRFSFEIGPIPIREFAAFMLEYHFMDQAWTPNYGERRITSINLSQLPQVISAADFLALSMETVVDINTAKLLRMQQ